MFLALASCMLASSCTLSADAVNYFPRKRKLFPPALENGGGEPGGEPSQGSSAFSTGVLSHPPKTPPRMPGLSHKVKSKLPTQLLNEPPAVALPEEAPAAALPTASDTLPAPAAVLPAAAATLPAAPAADRPSIPKAKAKCRPQRLLGKLSNGKTFHFVYEACQCAQICETLCEENVRLWNRLDEREREFQALERRLEERDRRREERDHRLESRLQSITAIITDAVGPPAAARPSSAP